MVISAAEGNNVNNHYRRDACIVHGTSLRQNCYPSGTICPIVVFTTTSLPPSRNHVWIPRLTRIDVPTNDSVCDTIIEVLGTMAILVIGGGREPTCTSADETGQQGFHAANAQIESPELLSIYQIVIASPSYHLPMLSDTCFYLLFASVGTAVNLSSAISGGPSALLFALLVLCVHSVRRGKECLTKDTMDSGTALSTPTKSSLGMRQQQRRQVFRNMTQTWPSSGWKEVRDYHRLKCCHWWSIHGSGICQWNKIIA